MARWTADALGAKAVIEPYADRRAALEGADHVITMIRVGGHQGLKLDFDIPSRYGVKQAMGDTLGLGSIFRALCSIPPLLDLARDMAEICPDAWLFNYTNPMAALCWAVYDGTPHQKVVGVCMSPDNTAAQLAELIGVPFEELTYLVAGMNHQSWVLRLESEGQDLYPRLRELLDADPEGLGRRVRMEIFKRLGYFPSESSEHNVDLVPWFLPHEGMVERYRVTVDEYVRRSERNLGTYDEVKRKLGAGEAARDRAWPGVRTPDHPLDRDGNAPDDLWERSEHGPHREPPGGLLRGGALPGRPLRRASRVDRSASAAARRASTATTPTCASSPSVPRSKGSREHVYHAAMVDPNTAATLTLEQIHAVCDDLIEAHGAEMPEGIRS